MKELSDYTKRYNANKEVQKEKNEAMTKQAKEMLKENPELKLKIIPELTVTGKPRVYKYPEQLAKECNRYFEYCELTERKPTKSELALFLQFADRNAMMNYKKNTQFQDIIKRALSIIEAVHERGLDSRFYGGHIFALKNFGWTDKQEIEVKQGLSLTDAEQLLKQYGIDTD